MCAKLYYTIFHYKKDTWGHGMGFHNQWLIVDQVMACHLFRTQSQCWLIFNCTQNISEIQIKIINKAHLPSNGPHGTNCMKVESIYKTFHSTKCIWKCCLQNVCHFVSASMCEARQKPIPGQAVAGPASSLRCYIDHSCVTGKVKETLASIHYWTCQPLCIEYMEAKLFTYHKIKIKWGKKINYGTWL